MYPKAHMNDPDYRITAHQEVVDWDGVDRWFDGLRECDMWPVVSGFTDGEGRSISHPDTIAAGENPND